MSAFREADRFALELKLDNDGCDAVVGAGREGDLGCAAGEGVAIPSKFTPVPAGDAKPHLRDVDVECDIFLLPDFWGS